MTAGSRSGEVPQEARRRSCRVGRGRSATAAPGEAGRRPREAAEEPRRASEASRGRYPATDDISAVIRRGMSVLRAAGGPGREAAPRPPRPDVLKGGLPGSGLILTALLHRAARDPRRRLSRERALKRPAGRRRDPREAPQQAASGPCSAALRRAVPEPRGRSAFFAHCIYFSSAGQPQRSFFPPLASAGRATGSSFPQGEKPEAAPAALGPVLFRGGDSPVGAFGLRRAAHPPGLCEAPDAAFLACTRPPPPPAPLGARPGGLAGVRPRPHKAEGFGVRRSCARRGAASASPRGLSGARTVLARILGKM